MKRAAILICLAEGACATPQVRQPLPDKVFEAAKLYCGATDAFILDADGARGVTFRGVAQDFGARQAQAICLKDQLKGTDLRFVGFLSDWPRR